MSAVPAANRGLITLGLMMGAVMSTLDTTVVNVALPHMQGSLSAASEQITWVITSYIVAVAVTTPASGWLASRVGLKPMLLICIGGFTTASMLCGLATNLPQMVTFRIAQGMLAAPMGPLVQAVLFNINPPERYGRAMALFTMAAVLAPVLGPVVGGYLTENYSWRWCFYVNLPAGIGSMILVYLFLPAEATRPRRFDYLGFGSLAVAVGAFQLMLDRGTTLDWFSSTEICVEALIAAGSLWVYAIHTLTARSPLIPLALMRDRNLMVSALFGLCFSGISFCSLTILPLMMQGLFGYSVIQTGVLSMPRGVAMLVVLQCMGWADSRFDRRLMVAIGLTFIVAAFWQMSKFDLSMAKESFATATILQGIGQGIIFVPLMTLGFATISPELRPDASAITNLSRNLGGSIGVAAMQAMTAVNVQTMHASLAGHVAIDDPRVATMLPDMLSPETAGGAAALNGLITRQATMVAYIDDFLMLALLAVAVAPLILLLRQPRRIAGAPREVVEVGHG